jgi:hypothetical protein
VGGFASSLLPAADGLDAAALRDHAEQILRAVAKDLRTAQTRQEQAAFPSDNWWPSTALCGQAC